MKTERDKYQALQKHRHAVRDRAQAGADLSREEVITLICADLYDRVEALEAEIAHLRGQLGADQ